MLPPLINTLEGHPIGINAKIKGAIFSQIGSFDGGKVCAGTALLDFDTQPTVREVERDFARW